MSGGVSAFSGIMLRASSSSRPNSNLVGRLEVTRTRETVLLQRVQPRTTIPSEVRSEAVQAMSKANIASALSGVSTHQHVLEVISSSDHQISPFVYSPTHRERKRPKGRPEFVPGAMNFETSQKFREQQEVMQLMNERDRISDPEIDAIKAVVEAKKMEKNKQTKGVRGVSSEWNDHENDDWSLLGRDPAIEMAAKRKRVVKSLPKPRVDREPDLESLSKKNRNMNGMDLQKYYKTDLLTADEEYSLGMKIQFMIRCEEVHEGLAIRLMRLPTIVEWAEACGFTDPDPDFIATEADELLRPVGSDSMFEETDPNMFVGNGLAVEAGPGRGRGRAKKPPPCKLKDFFDDSCLRDSQQSKTRKTLKPTNRGSATHFVEILMNAREAKQRMVQSNMRLVLSIARKYSNVGVSLQDLIQEGSLGLSRAAEKFDPKKGFKFSTYASWWIQQAVFRSIAYHSRTIRLPVHVHNLLNRVRKVRSGLQTEMGRAPTNEEVAQKLGMPLEKYNKMLHLTKRAISLETPKYQSNPKDLGHESEDLLGDTISSSTLQDDTAPEKRVDSGIFHEDLREMLKILDEDERRVIMARYGLADGLTRTVTAVATQMKQSKAWVRSQECRALRKLRRPWYEKKLREHQQALIS